MTDPWLATLNFADRQVPSMGYLAASQCPRLARSDMIRRFAIYNPPTPSISLMKVGANVDHRGWRGSYDS